MKCCICKNIWDLGEEKQEEDFMCKYCFEKKYPENKSRNKNYNGGRNNKMKSTDEPNKPIKANEKELWEIMRNSLFYNVLEVKKDIDNPNFQGYIFDGGWIKPVFKK